MLSGDDACEGGLNIAQWADLYFACTRMTQHGPQRWAWPDGQPLTLQPAVAVAMFEVFDWAVGEEMEAARDRK